LSFRTATRPVQRRPAEVDMSGFNERMKLAETKSISTLLPSCVAK